MAEGLSNAGIADKLVISSGAVEKRISNVFQKLDLEPGDGAHRRVLAVLAYLGDGSPGSHAGVAVWAHEPTAIAG